MSFNLILFYKFDTKGNRPLNSLKTKIENGYEVESTSSGNNIYSEPSEELTDTKKSSKDRMDLACASQTTTASADELTDREERSMSDFLFSDSNKKSPITLQLKPKLAVEETESEDT